MNVFTRDSEGIAEILTSQPLGDAVASYADAIAARIQTEHPDAEVVVDRYTTDRAAASVTVRDLRARLWQVRDGLLTRAAADVGLEVHGP